VTRIGASHCESCRPSPHWHFFDYANAGRDVERCRVPAATNPQTVVALPEGRIVAESHGEFGGGTYLVDSRGRRTVLVPENTHALIHIHSKNVILAIAGLAHLGSNHGAVYAIRRVGPVWSAQKRVILPGEPQSTRALATGEILIDTLGGTVSIGPAFAIRLFQCRSQ